MTQDTLFDTPLIQAAPKPQHATTRTTHPYDWAGPSGWRAAHPHRCPHCRAHILVGPDEDQCAFTAQVTATPLTPLGEALHLLAGTPTYSLSHCGNRGIKLTRRRATTITHQPAGSPGIDILPAHHCNPPPAPPEAHTLPTIAPPASLTAPRNAPPPF